MKELTSAMIKILNVDLTSMGNKGMNYASKNFEQNTLFKKIVKDRECLVENSAK